MAPGAQAATDLRGALIDAAARLVATEGPSRLTLRRLAEDVGTSTMAIYTYFGGMPELWRAIRHEGFSRLAAQLHEVTETADPVADLTMLGRAYCANAVGNPDLYRVAFMQDPLDEVDAEAGSEAFTLLVAGVERCIAAGRFDPADAEELATEFWALGHGVIALALARLITSERATETLESGTGRLFTAWGDAPDATRASLRRAARRRL